MDLVDWTDSTILPCSLSTLLWSMSASHFFFPADKLGSSRHLTASILTTQVRTIPLAPTISTCMSISRLIANICIFTVTSCFTHFVQSAGFIGREEEITTVTWIFCTSTFTNVEGTATNITFDCVMANSCILANLLFEILGHFAQFPVTLFTFQGLTSFQ